MEHPHDHDQYPFFVKHDLHHPQLLVKQTNVPWFLRKKKHAFELNIFDIPLTNT